MSQQQSVNINALVRKSPLALLGVLGAFGSCTSDLFCFFFDSIRTKMSMGGTQGTPKYSSLWDCIKRTYHTSGLKGFYKGFSACLLRQFPDSFVTLYTFEGLKRKLIQNDEQFAFKKYLLAGSVAGFMGSLVGNPFEIIKVRLINDVKKEKYQGVWDCMKKTYKEHGWRGFSKGLSLNAPRNVIWNAFELSFYEIYKQALVVAGMSKSSSKTHLLAGAMSGVSGTLLISPLEVVNIRYINQLKGQRLFTSPVQCAMNIWRTQGFRGFYSGYVPFSLTYTPWSIFFFASYERYKYMVLPLFVN